MKFIGDFFDVFIGFLFIVSVIAIVTIGYLAFKDDQDGFKEGNFYYYCTKEGTTYFKLQYTGSNLVPLYDQEGKIVKCEYHQTKL